jgi:hypothetical protein
MMQHVPHNPLPAEMCQKEVALHAGLCESSDAAAMQQPPSLPGQTFLFGEAEDFDHLAGTSRTRECRSLLQHVTEE